MQAVILQGVDQLVHIRFKLANGRRAIGQGGITGNSAQFENQALCLIETQKRLFDKRSLPRLHQMRTNVVLNGNRVLGTLCLGFCIQNPVK